MYVYSGYGLTFDGATFQSFDNDTHRDLMDFGVDNSSYLILNSFTILGEVRCFTLHDNADNSYLFA